MSSIENAENMAKIVDSGLNKKIGSDFRFFVNELWMRHKDELMQWEGKMPEYDAKYYFHKHRWMIRQWYREDKAARARGERND